MKGWYASWYIVWCRFVIFTAHIGKHGIQASTVTVCSKYSNMNCPTQFWTKDATDKGNCKEKDDLKLRKHQNTFYKGLNHNQLSLARVKLHSNVYRLGKVIMLYRAVTAFFPGKNDRTRVFPWLQAVLQASKGKSSRYCLGKIWML